MSLRNQKGQPAVEYLLLMSMVVSAIWMFCRPGGPGEVIVNGPPQGPGVRYNPDIDTPGGPPNDPGISSADFFRRWDDPRRIDNPGVLPPGADVTIGANPPITMTVPSEGFIYILGKKKEPVNSLDITQGTPGQFVVDPAPDSFDPVDLTIAKKPSKEKQPLRKGFVLEP